jgi:hypothetical protein
MCSVYLHPKQINQPGNKTPALGRKQTLRKWLPDQGKSGHWFEAVALG